MITKIILLFLAFMALLGMFGKWRFPTGGLIGAAKCPRCGRAKIGSGPCPCQKER